MLQGERLSAVAKRRRLNGTLATGTSSPTPVTDDQLEASPEIEHEVSNEENGFASLANQNLVQLSSIKEVDTVNEVAIKIRLSRSQQCLVSGIYILWLKRGSIALYGARLHASKEHQERYTVFAPENYDIPPITSLSESSEFELANFEDEYPAGFGFRSYAWATTPHEMSITRSFIVHGVSPEDTMKVGNLKYLDSSAAEMACNTLRAPNSNALTFCSPRLIVSGARFAGISSACLAIINVLVTETDDRGNCRYPQGLLVLDLDPHQPDFGPPGSISLVSVKQPIFGPAFTRCEILPHKVLLDKKKHKDDARSKDIVYQILEMNFIGETSNMFGEERTFNNFLQTAARYSKIHPECPLIVKALDLCEFLAPEFLDIMQAAFAPTHVFGVRSIFSGTVETYGRLLASNAGIPFYDLQATTVQEPSPFEQHIMAIRSYFHLRNFAPEDYIPCLRWDPLPVRLFQGGEVAWIRYDQRDSECFLRSIWCIGGNGLTGRNLLEVLVDCIVAFVHTTDDSLGLDSRPTINKTTNSHYHDEQFVNSVDSRLGTAFNDDQTMRDHDFRQPTIVCNESTLHLPMIHRIDSSIENHYYSGMGIIKSIDIFERKLCIWSPLTAKTSHRHLTQPGYRLNLVAQPMDAHGRFSTSWLRYE